MELFLVQLPVKLPQIIRNGSSIVMTLMWPGLIALICLRTMIDGKQVLRETTAFAEQNYDQNAALRGTRNRERINLSVPGEISR